MADAKEQKSGTTSGRSCALCKKEVSTLRKCGACQKVWYCSRDCQKGHWKDHKKDCVSKQKQNKPEKPVEKAVARHLRDDNADEVEVTWEDQQRINRFNKLIGRLQELNVDVTESKKQIANLDDCASEIEMLLDDDSCLLRVGEVFVGVSNGDAEEKAKEIKQETELKQKEMLAEKEKIETEVSELKKLLYSKFGKSINLEYEEDE